MRSVKEIPSHFLIKGTTTIQGSIRNIKCVRIKFWMVSKSGMVC